MSMGYDCDDPRGDEVRAAFKAGAWRLKPGDKPAPRPTRCVPHRMAWHGSFTK